MKSVERLIKTKSTPLLIFMAVTVSRSVYFISSYVAARIKGDEPSIDLFCQYDCQWYLTIINTGYMDNPLISGHVGAANWAFFPLFPLLVKFFGFIFNANPILIGIFLNNLLYSVFLYFIMAYHKIKFPLVNQNYLLFILTFSPFSIYFNSLYTEALFLCLLAIIIFSLERRMWIFVGLLGFLLSGSRVTGALFILLLFIKIYEYRDEVPRQNIRKVTSLFLFPSGLIAFMFYLHFKTGDFLAFKHIQKAWGFGDLSFLDWVYGVFSSSSITQWGYLLTIVGGFMLSLYFLKLQAWTEFVVLVIPVIVSVLSVAINYRYFYVLYPYATFLSLIMNRSKFIKYFVFATLPLILITVEVAWINGAGYLV